jgi:hypothetical protein
MGIKIIAENARIGKNSHFRGHNSNTGNPILLNICRQVELSKYPVSNSINVVK